MSEKSTKKRLVTDTPQERQKKQKLKLIGVSLFALLLIISLASALFDSGEVNFITKAEYVGVGATSSEDQRNETFARKLQEAEKERVELNKKLDSLLPLVELLKKQAEEGEERASKANNEDGKSGYISPPVKSGNKEGEAEIVSNKEIEEILNDGGDIKVVEPPKILRKSLSNNNTRDNPFAGKRKESTARKDNSSAVLSLVDSTPTSSKRMTNDVLSVKEKYIKNEMAGFLPATSAVPIVVYTGLDAKAGGGSTGEPEPVHFRFQDDAVLPGNSSYRLVGCRGVAVGTGDLSSVRVKLKASRIVCIDVLEDKILETQINGFVTDSDGTLGFRGKLNNREGNIAAKAFAATFIEGAAQLIQSANTTTQNLGGSTVSSIDGGSALQYGIAGGSGNAAKILSERYIEQMEAISPTIGIGKGRRGTLHISEGTELEWRPYSGAYRKQITPISKGDS